MKYHLAMFRKALTILLFLLPTISLSAQDVPPVPNPPRLVNDFVGFLSADEANRLERKLVIFNDSTSIQIAVVIVQSIGSSDIESYANKLFRTWGIGQKGKDNGILILIAPQERKMRIETGYKAEGPLPDAICKRIIDNEIAPRFRVNKNYEALDSATSVIMAITRGELSIKDYKKKTQNKSVGGFPIFAIILFIVIMVIVGRSRKGRATSMGGSLPFWAAMSMFSATQSNHHSGFFNDFSSGGGDFGGFGGFGGGSSGGGGASGSW
jgi:uncharacterized protein